MEIWDVYNIHGEKLNKTHIRGEELPQGEYHLVVAVWIRNSKGDILIQKRAKSLGGVHNPWATTAGSVTKGESSLQGAIRETYEEMGILFKHEELKYLERFIHDVSLNDIYEVYYEGDCKEFDPVEVEKVKWVTPDELKNMVNRGQFYDFGSQYFKNILRSNLLN